MLGKGGCVKATRGVGEARFFRFRVLFAGETGWNWLEKLEGQTRAVNWGHSLENIKKQTTIFSHCPNRPALKQLMEEFEQGIWRVSLSIIILWPSLMVASFHLGSLATRLGSLLVLPAFWLHLQRLFLFGKDLENFFCPRVCVLMGVRCVRWLTVRLVVLVWGPHVDPGLAYLPTELLLQVCNGEVSATWKQMYSWRPSQILQKDKQISWWRSELIWATKLECSYDSI